MISLASSRDRMIVSQGDGNLRHLKQGKEIGSLSALDCPCPDDHLKLILRSTNKIKGSIEVKGFEFMGILISITAEEDYPANGHQRNSTNR